MSPEFYAIIGVGASLAGLIVALAGLMLYLFVHANRRIDRLGERVDRLEDQTTQRIDRLEDTFTQRIDRLEDTFTQRMNRLEEKFDQMQGQFAALEKRVVKLEWILDAEFRNSSAPPDRDGS